MTSAWEFVCDTVVINGGLKETFQLGHILPDGRRGVGVVDDESHKPGKLNGANACNQNKRLA
jgi:hypothetical protein